MGGGTHRDDPPVAQLTGGIGQDEHGEAEDSQQLHETVGRTEEKRVWERKQNQNNLITDSKNNYWTEWATYENVKEGVVIVVMQDFFTQLLLDAAVHLPHKQKKWQLIILPPGAAMFWQGSDPPPLELFTSTCEICPEHLGSVSYIELYDPEQGDEQQVKGDKEAESPPHVWDALILTGFVRANPCQQGRAGQPRVYTAAAAAVHHTLGPAPWWAVGGTAPGH